MELRHGLYEKAGVLEYWVVYQEEENVIVFLLNENHKYNGAIAYSGDDTIHSKTISGFSINLDDIFTK